MARKLTILGILALLAAVPASASTLLMFMQNSGTPAPLIITDITNAKALNYLGSTTISLTDAPILWDMPNTLGTGYRTGLLTFTASTFKAAYGVLPANDLYEIGFSGSVSIRDVATQAVMLSWTFNSTGTLTVANNGHTGSFVDSAPLSSEGVYASPYINLSALTSETFHFSLLATQSWTSNGVPIIYDAAVSLGTCTSCRVIPNTASLWAPDDSGAPEPATIAMLGSALIGLGLLGRKRFIR